MPDAIVIQVADAVAAELNSASLSQPFTAHRGYRPVQNIADMPLTITVVPIARRSILLNRAGASFNDYTIDIGIDKRLPEGPLTDDEINAFCDPLMFLCEEIVALFYESKLTDYPDARCTNVNNEPIFAPHRIDDLRTFTSIITLTFRVGTSAGVQSYA